MPIKLTLESSEGKEVECHIFQRGDISELEEWVKERYFREFLSLSDTLERSPIVVANREKRRTQGLLSRVDQLRITSCKPVEGTIIEDQFGPMEYHRQLSQLMGEEPWRGTGLDFVLHLQRQTQELGVGFPDSIEVLVGKMRG